MLRAFRSRPTEAGESASDRFRLRFVKYFACHALFHNLALDSPPIRGILTAPLLPEDQRIMPVPRRRHCPARQGKSRTHKKLFATQLVACENCDTLKLRHRICPACGTYKKVEYRPVEQS